jgi:hypothetical protein
LSDVYRRRNPNRITRELEIAVAELERAAGKKPQSLKELEREFAKEFAHSAKKKATASSGR